MQILHYIFENPAHPNYVDPAIFGPNVGKEEIRKRLKEFITAIKERQPRLGAPPAGTPALQEFWGNVENAITNTLSEIKKVSNPKERRKLATKVFYENRRAREFLAAHVIEPSGKVQTEGVIEMLKKIQVLS
jgi:hypothetical protein